MLGKLTLMLSDDTETRLRRWLINKYGEKYFGYISPAIEFSVREALDKAENDEKFEAKMVETVGKEKEAKMSQRVESRKRTLGLQ